MLHGKKGVSMVRKFLIVCGILLFVLGCGQQYVTEDNPWGFKDPNSLRMWLNAANDTGEMGRNVGVLTGNPALVGGGFLATGIISIIVATLFPKKKKEGEE